MNQALSAAQLDARENICQAALACVRRFGYGRATMSDFAREGGISRRTLYKYYKSKDEVLFSAIDQAAYRFAESVVDHARQFTTLEDRVIETIIYVVQGLPKDPDLSLILHDDMAKAFRDRAFSDEATIVFSEMTAGPLIEIEPALAEQGVEITEIMSRFAISMILFPGKYATDIEGLRGLIKRRLLPGLI